MSNNEFINYLKDLNAQEKINKLAKIYKDKKIVIYGAGQYSRTIFENYDLSKLNIIAVADIKFEKENYKNFFKYNCIKPEDLGTIDCDVILIANFDYNYFLVQLDDHILYETKNENICIRPLIKTSFSDIFLKRNK